MSFNGLAINVGNTRTQFAPITDGSLGDLQHVPHDRAEDLPDAINAVYQSLTDAGHADPVALLASVNQSAADNVIEALTICQCPTATVEDHLPVPIGRKLDPETIVGVDRLLNAAAAYDKLKQAVIVVDAGSALPVDFIDGEGTFHGGAICPGAQLQLKALHQHTAQLPELTFTKPEETLGHSTAQAILTGIYHGIRGAARELVEAYAAEYGAYPTVIATGGDAVALFSDYDLVGAVVPELTLQGLVVARRTQLEQEDND